VAGPLLEIDDLQTHFFTAAGTVRAVDGVSYSVAPGETLGVVGESGCGKSVTALSVLRLVADPPGRIVGGAIRFAGRNLLDLSEAGQSLLLQRLEGGLSRLPFGFGKISYLGQKAVFNVAKLLAGLCNPPKALDTLAVDLPPERHSGLALSVTQLRRRGPDVARSAGCL
jgi:energy-coupling factor transporter ATP-binding protein EcfA2